MEWKDNTDNRTRPDHRIRCVEPRMGSILPGHQHRWPMVNTRENPAHKLPRVTSSHISSKNLCEGQLSVLLKIDNSCLYRGTVSKELVSLTQDLWMWCLERNIHIQAQYLPEILNHSADMESRSMKDRSDWKLDRQTFVKINERYGPLEVDLFASRLTAVATSVGSQIRLQRQQMHSFKTGQYGGDMPINPPWNLIPRVLRKTQVQGAEVILVAPVWNAQSWYALLLSLLAD